MPRETPQSREQAPSRPAPAPADPARDPSGEQLAWAQDLPGNAAGGSRLPPSDVIRLQRTLGNHATGRFLNGSTLPQSEPAGHEPAARTHSWSPRPGGPPWRAAALRRLIQRTDFPEKDVNARMLQVSPVLLALLRDEKRWNIEDTLDALNQRLAGNAKAQAGLAVFRGMKGIVTVMKDLLLAGDAGWVAKLEALAPFDPAVAIAQLLAPLNAGEKDELRHAVATHPDGPSIRGDMAEILAKARLRRIYQNLGGAAQADPRAAERQGKLATLGQGAQTSTGGNIECLELVPGYTGIADYQNKRSQAFGYADYNDYKAKRVLPPAPAPALAPGAAAAPAPAAAAAVPNGPNQALDAELGRAFSFRQSPGQLWRSHGELDVAVIANPPGGAKPIILELQQVKSGAQDLPATAQAQNVTTLEVLKKVRDGNPNFALFQKISHVQLGANVSAVYDLRNIEQALTSTMGPKGNKPFDEKFDYSAEELLQVATALKANPALIV